MYIVVPAIIINILAIIILLIGLLYNFEKPQNKAAFGYYVAISLMLYLIALCVVAVYKFIIKPDLYCFVLLLCVVLPFVIGKLVKYETLKKYTTIQILCYFVSLITLFLSY